MRLIDADALAEKVKALHGHGDYEADLYLTDASYCLGAWVWDNPEDYGIEEAEKAIKDAPTVDAVPVVRCGQCNRFESCELGRLWLGADGFCSDGERRNDG